MDNSTTVQYASHIQRLCQQARSAVRDIDPQNDLSFLRIRTKKHEVMVAPGTITRTLKFIYYVSLALHAFKVTYPKVDTSVLVPIVI